MKRAAIGRHTQNTRVTTRSKSLPAASQTHGEQPRMHQFGNAHLACKLIIAMFARVVPIFGWMQPVFGCVFPMFARVVPMLLPCLPARPEVGAVLNNVPSLGALAETRALLTRLREEEIPIE